MCIVLPFARQRFTPFDMIAWNAVAGERRRRGLWQKVERASSRERDWLSVWLPGMREPTLRVERDTNGTYRLLFNNGDGWQQCRQGAEIIDCLVRVDPDHEHQNVNRRVD